MIPSLKEWIAENVPFDQANEAAALFDDERCQLRFVQGAYALGRKAEEENHNLLRKRLEAQIEGLRLALQDKTHIHHDVINKTKSASWWRKS